MSLDQALREAVEQTVRETIERELVARLNEGGINLIAPPDDRPLDAKALQERGYSAQEAYSLLRNHGQRLPGARRARIARSVLERIERGEVPA